MDMRPLDAHGEQALASGLALAARLVGVERNISIEEVQGIYDAFLDGEIDRDDIARARAGDRSNHGRSSRFRMGAN